MLCELTSVRLQGVSHVVGLLDPCAVLLSPSQLYNTYIGLHNDHVMAKKTESNVLAHQMRQYTVAISLLVLFRSPHVSGYPYFSGVSRTLTHHQPHPYLIRYAHARSHHDVTLLSHVRVHVDIYQYSIKDFKHTTHNTHPMDSLANH